MASASEERNDPALYHCNVHHLILKINNCCSFSNYFYLNLTFKVFFEKHILAIIFKSTASNLAKLDIFYMNLKSDLKMEIHPRKFNIFTEQYTVLEVKNDIIFIFVKDSG